MAGIRSVGGSVFGRSGISRDLTGVGEHDIANQLQLYLCDAVGEIGCQFQSAILLHHKSGNSLIGIGESIVIFSKCVCTAALLGALCIGEKEGSVLFQGQNKVPDHAHAFGGVGGSGGVHTGLEFALVLGRSRGGFIGISGSAVGSIRHIGSIRGFVAGAGGSGKNNGRHQKCDKNAFHNRVSYFQE